MLGDWVMMQVDRFTFYLHRNKFQLQLFLCEFSCFVNMDDGIHLRFIHSFKFCPHTKCYVYVEDRKDKDTASVY